MGIRVCLSLTYPVTARAGSLVIRSSAARLVHTRSSAVPGIFEPALDPTREEVYKFLETFLGEMAALFPDDYLHIGGDENEGKQWDRNPAIQDYMKKKGIKDNHALQAYFNTRLLKILQKHGKKMIGWDEILQPELPKDVVIHSWRGTAALAEAARKGYDGILSNGYYIDLIQPASQHYVRSTSRRQHADARKKQSTF